MLKHAFSAARKKVDVPRRKKPRSQSHSSQESTSATTPTPSSGVFSRRHNDRWMHNQSDGENEDDGAGQSVPMASTEDDEDEEDDDDDLEDEHGINVDGNNNNEDDDEVLRCLALGAAIYRRATTAACEMRLKETVVDIQLPSKVSRRRPPSGADGAVRRWNSFHSTRGECHPNKFRQNRKSASPSPPPYYATRQSPLSTSPRITTSKSRSYVMANQRSGARAAISGGIAELQRGRSLATSDTGLMMIPTVDQKLAASIW